MAKRIVNKAERNAERYDAKETGYRLFEDSQNGKTFDRLAQLISALLVFAIFLSFPDRAKPLHNIL